MSDRERDAAYGWTMSQPLQTPAKLKAAQNALSRMQGFDPQSLARRGDLGERFDMTTIEALGTQLVEQYRAIPPSCLRWLGDPCLESLARNFEEDFAVLHKALGLSPSQPNVRDELDKLGYEVSGRAATMQNRTMTTTAYAIALEAANGGVAAQVLQRADEAHARISENDQKLQTALGEARGLIEILEKGLAQHGVTQQSKYFGEDATSDSKAARNWLWATGILAAVLALVAGGALFVHKVPELTPTTTYETVQLAIGKVLVISTITFALVLCSRNYTANRHNAIVNRHRQNALRTYRALVEAGGDAANRDIVLNRAAECIFGAQPTGFGRADGADGGSTSLISFGPGAIRATPPSSTGA